MTKTEITREEIELMTQADLDAFEASDAYSALLKDDGPESLKTLRCVWDHRDYLRHEALWTKIDNAVPGDGISICIYTDTNPYTVVRRTKSTIWLSDDDWKVINGSMYDGSAEYEITPKPKAVAHETACITRRTYKDNNGRTRVAWVQKGASTHGGGCKAGFGRRKHYDPSF